jgi:Ni,Fe-hydrogenase III large subunit
MAACRLPDDINGYLELLLSLLSIKLRPLILGNISQTGVATESSMSGPLGRGAGLVIRMRIRQHTSMCTLVSGALAGTASYAIMMVCIFRV